MIINKNLNSLSYFQSVRQVGMGRIVLRSVQIVALMRSRTSVTISTEAVPVTQVTSASDVENVSSFRLNFIAYP